MMYTTSNRNVGSGVNFLTFEEERVIELPDRRQNPLGRIQIRQHLELLIRGAPALGKTNFGQDTTESFLSLCQTNPQGRSAPAPGEGSIPPPSSKVEMLARPERPANRGGRSVVCQTLPPMTESWPIRTRPRIEELE